jgi:hypothetical protein
LIKVRISLSVSVARMVTTVIDGSFGSKITKAHRLSARLTKPHLTPSLNESLLAP